MGVFSASNLLKAVALFHITLGWFFMASPATVADQTMVLIVGEAMSMPHARVFDAKSPALSFLGLIFIFWGISDLVSLSIHEDAVRAHWGVQAPVRLTMLFALCFYTYGTSAAGMTAKGYASGSVGDGLKNRVFFTWAFVEMMLWFWIFSVLREERRAASLVAAAKRQLEETS